MDIDNDNLLKNTSNLKIIIPKRTIKRKRGGKKKRTKKKKKMRGGMNTPESNNYFGEMFLQHFDNEEDITDTPENWEDGTAESDNYLGEMLLQQFDNEEDYLWPNNPSVQVNIEDLDPVDIYDMPIEVMYNIADNLDFNDCKELRNYCVINPRICALD